MDRLQKDLEALEHDRAVESGEKKDDTIFRSDKCPCPDPLLCSFQDHVCVACGKRDGPVAFTKKLTELRTMQLGGLRLLPVDLGWSQWLGLGMLAKKTEANKWPI